jgi:hypothetical protein
VWSPRSRSYLLTQTERRNCGLHGGKPSPDRLGRLPTLGAVSDTSSDVPLGGQQRALFLAIAEHDSELANWYLGARMAFATPANPEYLVHAAHSVRELMSNLHKIAGVPVKVDTGRLNDRFDAMKTKWEKAKRNSTAFTEEEGWHGEIDEHARRGCEAVDDAIAWYAANRVAWKERHLETIRVLDVSGRPLPAWIEKDFVTQWDTLRTYFIRVAHRDPTPREDFEAALDTLERFVLERLRPRTYSDQTTLDALIREAEGRD